MTQEEADRLSRMARWSKVALDNLICDLPLGQFVVGQTINGNRKVVYVLC